MGDVSHTPSEVDALGRIDRAIARIEASTRLLADREKALSARHETLRARAGALRGVCGRRVGKVGLGRLGDPRGLVRAKIAPTKEWSESIRTTLCPGESERLVVAKKRSNARGAKGPWQRRSGLRESWS